MLYNCNSILLTIDIVGDFIGGKYGRVSCCWDKLLQTCDSFYISKLRIMSVYFQNQSSRGVV